MSAAGCTTTSPWLRRTPNGLRASKASRSVLHGATPVLATIDERNIGPSRRGFDKPRSPTDELCVPGDVRPLTPSTPPQIAVHPFAAQPSTDDESSEDEFEFRPASPHGLVIDSDEGNTSAKSPPMSPLSFRSRETSATEESTVQIVRARAQRINTARARSHSINEIRQLLSPPPESAAQHLLPPWSPLRIAHPQPDSLGNEPGPSTTLSPGTPVPVSQFSPRSPSSGPLPPPPPRRRSHAIVKDMGSLLEHINEDEHDHLRLNSTGRTTRSVSLPVAAPPCSDSALTVVSLPPPPRPRNRALVRKAVQTHSSSNLHSTPIQSSQLPTPTPPVLVLQPPPRRSTVSECPPPVPPKDPKFVPTLAIPPRRDSLDHHRLSLYSIPWTPVGIPLPPSTATSNFPQSPHSTVFHTVGSPPATPQSASFLPSCKATSVRSSTIREDWQSRASDDRPDRSSNRLSTLSNPFGDFSFLRPYPNNRASGISFSSDISGSSARSPTEAESIPIGLHRATSQDAERDESLLPVTPRSSWLRSGFEVDIRLPQPDEDEEDDESVTEESSRKSTEKSSLLSGRERAKSLTLPYIPIASLNKVDRVLGKGASRALISGVHDHVPHLSSPSSMSSSPENTTPTSAAIVLADPAQQSFLPSTAPPSAFSMGPLGRRLSKKSSPSPSSERRRSEEVPRPSSQATGGLMARMDRFIGRTPSPAGRTRELDSEDEASPPPPILTFPKTIHGRKHSSSDPSTGVAPIPLSGRPSTSNMRTAAERAEMLKKARKIQQVLGDVPPTCGSTGSAFYRVSRAARSEDSLVTPTATTSSAVVVVGGPVDARGHRSTASLSSRPLLALSPALQTDGLLDIKTSANDDFGLGLNEGGMSPVMSTRAEGEDGDVDGPEHEEDEAMLARRAKRAKVAKLNRYLGSRVPANLILGLDENWDYEQGLPEVRSEDGGETGSVWSGRKKRRASDGDYTLLEEDMNDLSVMSSEEKARAVKRKAKMEQMFGEHPPQKLYQVPTGTDTPSRSEVDEDGAELAVDHGAEPLDGPEGGEHYQSYRASFNSLAYFVSTADRDSLEGLYDIVSGPSDDSEAQRNHFAARRKRAAKLSNFFGVSYRDLFGAVLDILESDVKEDKEEGSLSAAETQDLLRKLKSLKAKGQSIHG
ncbi:unnamed protein product [Rhizoctonia solani]|uniref:Uncharacterized protein n=1 Tax=Rhizoctonia solani TaxID=456999 RepID=A0A8H3C5W1_9AGAM|nr:unnamed protein product [Rhizoctonia solani]